MDIIKFTVYKQHLILNTDLRKRVATSDTVNQFKCQFTFDETWDGFEKRVYFKNLNYNTIKTTLLDASGYCYIPWEVIAHTGQIVCTVTGSKYSNGSLAARLTTNSIKFFLKNTGEGLYESIMTADPSPSEFEQFVAQVYNDAQIANSAKVAALEAQVKAELAESRIKGMTVSATGLAEDQNPTVTLTDFSDHFNLEFGIPAGHSPAITASKAAGVTTVKVDGSTVASIEDGADGQDGEDGYAPIATVLKSGDTATISITDKNGTTTTTVKDGQGTPTSTSPKMDADSAAVGSENTYARGDHIHASRFTLTEESADSDTGYSMYSLDDRSEGTTLDLYDAGHWENLLNTKQATLVSGTNIKTVNNTSLLGSGDISIKEIFIAEYNVTTFSEVEAAYEQNKIVFCRLPNKNYVLPLTSYYVDEDDTPAFTFCAQVRNKIGYYVEVFYDHGTEWLYNEYPRTLDFTTSFITSGVTGATGVMTSANAYYHFNVCHLSFAVKNASAVSAGGNLFLKKLTTSSLYPKQLATGVGYVGSSCCAVQLTAEGILTVRVTGASVAANTNVYCSLCYII